MKANKKFVEEKEAVSAVIGVILMVAITVAIAATVYVYVSGMIGTSPETAPSIQFTKDGTARTLTVAQADPTDIAWADFTISNSTGTEFTTASFGLTGNVDAGDSIDFYTYGAMTWNIRYDPTNTLMGSWTFV
jgi:flagellin-like protein